METTCLCRRIPKQLYKPTKEAPWGFKSATMLTAR